jgi:hypothetical protein
MRRLRRKSVLYCKIAQACDFDTFFSRVDGKTFTLRIEKDVSKKMRINLEAF